ncbi:MAG: NAD-dependent epimerase/dehydratase family protein [Actinomycetota bacterium]|nr:NAD-dependent epimerase/dehydratase family protein [Actinomycetota bacterium]MDD5601088.1 NAD-dependent epimerase/dehydratase family protein [Actinomycetota bacterium]
MKVLITGGAGFIGSNVADGLLDKNYDVVIVDDLSNGKEENIPEKAKFYKCDIRDKKIYDIFQAEKPDIVIHNAAQLSVRVSVENPLMDADINIMGGLNVINACNETKIKKIIFASSGGTVYGEQEYFPADENHPKNPVCPYGVAKLATENYLYYFYKTFGLEYISLRYANIYGPRQDPYGEAGVVAIFCRRILEGKNPIINGDGLQTRDYVYVGDAVDANIKAIESTFVGPVNIGTCKETSVIELFKLLKQISGKDDIEKVHGPAKEGEQRRSQLSYRLAREVLGWHPEVSIEKGLRLTYDWFKNH